MQYRIILYPYRLLSRVYSTQFHIKLLHLLTNFYLTLLEPGLKRKERRYDLNTSHIFMTILYQRHA